jgi:glycosyltransferase involved in cell wall biosynthesis
MDFFQATDPLVATANIISEKLMIKKNDFVFLFIGRLVKDKGLEELVDAFCQLKERYSDIKLLLVGPYEPELDPLQEDVHKRINQNDSIIQIDFQQDIRPYLIIGNVLTFPSYREGFPNVPMQAGCFDLPSIVSDINGCNEIIEHGKNGLIIPVKDRSALLQAMELLLTDQSLFLNLKANARTMIRERYEQKQFWNMLLNEYHHQLKLHDDVS